MACYMVNFSFRFYHTFRLITSILILPSHVGLPLQGGQFASGEIVYTFEVPMEQCLLGHVNFCFCFYIYAKLDAMEARLR